MNLRQTATLLSLLCLLASAAGCAPSHPLPAHTAGFFSAA